MQTIRLVFTAVLVFWSAGRVWAQSVNALPEPRRHFAGSSLFVLADALPDSPSFFQLNLGRWLTARDVLSIELITWRYTRPLGIPYGSAGEADDTYPGSVRGTGAGLAYQRFIWRGAYAAVHAAAMRQHYQDGDGAVIQHGFQLFTAVRLGYHVEFFAHRLFVEPSVAVTHWPVNTNAPPTFKALDERWPSYFVGEPGLHFGVRF